MGSVAITFRLMPESPETDLSAIQASVRKTLGTALRGVQVKDVAFGLRALLALAVVDDAGGTSERLESALSAIPGVGSVEVVDVTLV